MDNPEIKAILKSAKEAIKNKDLKEALKLCKVHKFNANKICFLKTSETLKTIKVRD